MAKIKLTKSTAAAAEPRASTYILFDSDLPGFGLRVTPAGAKSWVAEYRAKGGGRRAPTRRITIGSIALFNAEHARSAAKDILASVRLGADPAEERKLNREAATIAELAAEFIKPTAKVTRKQSTLDLLEIYFRRHINPAIGSKRAQDVTHDDVVRLHRKLGATHPATANRIVMALSGLFSWAIAKQKIRRADNPAKNIDRFVEKSRERFLSTEELARLGDALREAETEGLFYDIDDTKPTAKHAPKPENRKRIVDAHAVAAIRLLLLTGARLREILHLRWSEVDIERGFLNLGDSKTGQKTVVLNAPALLILSNLPRFGELVIASRSSGTENETPRADLHRPWTAITKHAGLTGLRIHDLRHTHASIGDPNVIERKDEVIPGLLGAGEVAVLTADTKVGKTQVATDISFKLSLGQTWYGRRLRTRKVFYCALEKHKVTRKRFRALQRLHAEVAPPIAISSAPVNLLDELCVDRLIAAVLDAGGVGLLVVDTFNRAAGGTDENSAGPMGTIFNNLTRIAEATGAAILILHHNSKSGDLRGSSAIPAGADVILTLVKEKDGARTLTLTQANDAIEGQTFRFRMNVVELSPATAVAPAETTVVIEPISDADGGDARASARSQSNAGDLRRSELVQSPTSSSDKITFSRKSERHARGNDAGRSASHC